MSEEKKCKMCGMGLEKDAKSLLECPIEWAYRHRDVYWKGRIRQIFEEIENAFAYTETNMVCLVLPDWRSLKKKFGLE